MILFPAIDLKDGKCVRLKLGEMQTATIYNEDPGAQAKAFEDQGFSWLHVARSQRRLRGPRASTVRRSARSSRRRRTRCNSGGGIRTLPQIEDWLDRGLARVDPRHGWRCANRELVKQACGEVSRQGRRSASTPRGGKVAVEGWAEASSLGVIELAKKFEGAGVAAIIYTDIDRDGVLTGINWEATHRAGRGGVDPGDRLGQARSRSTTSCA